MDVILVSGIFMSFFIGMLLLTKKNKAVADKILTVWIFVIGIHLLGFYFYQGGDWEQYPHLIGITAPIPLFHGPFLYLYCLYALRSEKHFRSIDYWHFLPGILAYLYMFKFFFFYSAEEKLLVDKGVIDDFSSFSIGLLILILLSGMSYAIISYRLTISYKHKIESRFSYSEGISLRWLRYFIISIGLIFLSAVMVFGLRDIVEVSFPFDPEYIFYTILILLIFYIGYYGIKYENIFVSNTLVLQNDKKCSPEKYRNSGMKDDEATMIYEKLMVFMKQEKPYLNPKLTLLELAKQMDLSTNQLSQIINQKAGMNFYDFVNRYRVDEFLQKAENNKHYSLLALAFDSGFNSKSSFNYIFKKQKGLSPSQYISKNQ